MLDSVDQHENVELLLVHRPDVRLPSEFESFHEPDAVNVPL